MLKSIISPHFFPTSFRTLDNSEDQHNCRSGEVDDWVGHEENSVFISAPTSNSLLQSVANKTALTGLTWAMDSNVTIHTATDTSKNCDINNFYGAQTLQT